MSDLIYRLETDDQERFRVIFSDDVDTLVSLPMSPAYMEPELQQGHWLILAFTIWDPKDRPMLKVAFDIARQLDSARVAVRPFEFGDEFAAWLPQLSSDAGRLYVEKRKSRERGLEVAIGTRSDDHPLWIGMKDGIFVEALVGSRDSDEVQEFAFRLFGR